jgi:arginyl-tRNA synthetase
MEIAQDIVSKIPKMAEIERIGIESPGFINFYLKKENLTANLGKILKDGDKYGSSEIGNGKKIVLEHTDVNPNKALHIGHLRSACLGSACEKTLEFLGYKVETQYYVDDTGVQVAVSALGVLELDVDQKEDEKYDHYAGRAYVKAMEALEKNKKLAPGSLPRRQAGDRGLEKKKEEIIATLDKQEGQSLDFIKKFINQVVKANLETTDLFGIDYDLLIWESDILKSKFWEKTFDLLKACPDFYQAKTGKNKGCWVLKMIDSPDLKNETNREKIIVKANGVVTYTGKDIAYHLWKYNLLGVDFKYAKWPTSNPKMNIWSTASIGKSNSNFGRAEKVINFIDSRQSYPQVVVKKSLDLLGFKKEAADLKHIAYGIVSLAPKTAKELGVEALEGKTQYAMSGRAGLAVLADDLLELVKTKLKQKHPDAPEPYQVASAAIKYLMLAYNPYSDLIFSYDHALDIYGNSGPYLQYSFARCNSVLKKAAKMKKRVEYSKDINEIDFTSHELVIMRWLIHFSETVSESGKQLAPNLLCNYAYELASRFNAFYNKRPILRSKKGTKVIQARLCLTAATAQVLRICLNLLGIKPVDKM